MAGRLVFTLLWGHDGRTLGASRVLRLLATLGEILIAQLGEGWGSERPVAFAGSMPAAGAPDLLRRLLLGMHVRLFGTLPESIDGTGDALRTPVDGLAGADDDAYRRVLNVALHESLRQFSLAHQCEPVVRAAGVWAVGTPGLSV